MVGVACDRCEAQTKCDAKAAYKTTKCYGHLFALAQRRGGRVGERARAEEGKQRGGGEEDRQRIATFPRGSHFEVFGRRCGFSGHVSARDYNGVALVDAIRSAEG